MWNRVENGKCSVDFNGTAFNLTRQIRFACIGGCVVVWHHQIDDEVEV